MSVDFPLVSSLAESAEKADRTMYEAEAARAPGGEYVVPHIYDGPYSFVALNNVDDSADFKALAVLDAFPPIRLSLDGGYGLESMLLVAVPKYGAAVLEWYADGETSYTVEEIELGSYDQPPTDRDLAVALPELFGHEDAAVFEDLRDTFATVFDTAGMPAMMALLKNLDDAILADPDQLLTAVGGVLTGPAA